MAVFRVEKTRNYTVMSNHHLRDKSLSLKAKGLLSLMLSLPEDWDYTTKGLACICKDGVDSICATVRELEGAGYIVRERERHADGTLGGIEYTILEQPREPEAPKREKPVQVENAGDAPKRAFPEQIKPVLGKPEQENPAQLNIQEQSKEILSTDSTKSFPSFPHKGKPIQESGMERRETYREQIMTNVDYDYLVGYTEVDRGRLDELVGLMLDTVCSTKPTLRVAGEELPAEVVRSRLLKLTGAHLRYVLDRINENTTEVRHVKPYLLTALYKRAAIHHRGDGAKRRGGNCSEGQNKNHYAAHKAVPQAAEIRQKVRCRPRADLSDEERKRPVPEVHLGGDEEAVRGGEGSAEQGVSPQPAGAVRPGVLRRLPGRGAFGGCAGTQQHRDDPHLPAVHGKRKCPPAGQVWPAQREGVIIISCNLLKTVK